MRVGMALGMEGVSSSGRKAAGDNVFLGWCKRGGCSSRWKAVSMSSIVFASVPEEKKWSGRRRGDEVCSCE